MKPNRKGPAIESHARIGDGTEGAPTQADYQKLLMRIDRLESSVAKLLKARTDAMDDGR
jgi:hypothetical protein